MIDPLEPHSILQVLDDARRRFEKGGPVPMDVGDRLLEVVDALERSGPLEFGIAPSTWLRAQGTARWAIECIGQHARARRARLALLVLRRMLGPAVRTTPRRLAFASPAGFVLCSAVVTGVSLLIYILRSGRFELRYFSAIVVYELILWSAWHPANCRARDARMESAAAADLAGDERPLAGCRMRGTGVLLATDRHVIAAVRTKGRFESLWSLPYGEIRAVEDESSEGMTLRSSGAPRRVKLRTLWTEGNDYQSHARAALGHVVKRRIATTDAERTPKASVRA